jgi:hypothetical protein
MRRRQTVALVSPCLTRRVLVRDRARAPSTRTLRHGHFLTLGTVGASRAARLSHKHRLLPPLRVLFVPAKFRTRGGPTGTSSLISETKRVRQGETGETERERLRRKAQPHLQDLD